MHMSKKIILAVVFGGYAASALAIFDGAVTAGNTSVWRMDSTNGSVSLCSESGADSPADCYPASSAEKDGEYRILVDNDILSTWRINILNGSVSKCEYDDTDKSPLCSPWSK
jgi:hypothetical protein